MPSKKYQRQDGGPGVGQIGALFASRIAPSMSSGVAEHFLASLTVNAALLNTDAHAKNYSLMLSGAKVTLAPMYDVLSIGAFLEPGVHPLFPMKLGATFDLEQVFPETMIAVGRRLNIPAEHAQSIVNATLSAVSAVLDVTAQDMSAYDRNGIISRTVEAIRQHSALIKSVM